MAEKTVNEEILDQLIVQQIFLMRFSSGLTTRLLRILNSNEPDVNRFIKLELKDVKLDNERDYARLILLADQLTALRQASWDEAERLAMEEFNELAEEQSDWFAWLYGAAIPVVMLFAKVPKQTLYALVNQSQFQGNTLREWFASMRRADAQRIRTEITAGVTARETPTEIARRVLGTRAARGADGATAHTRRQVSAVTRTITNGISNGVRDAFNRENSRSADSGLANEEQFVAILDNRTTPLCRSLDGNVYPVGRGPHPPLHVGCRSLRYAILNGKVIRSRPIKPRVERKLLAEFTKQNNLKPATSISGLPERSRVAYTNFARRRIEEMTGTTPNVENYSTWLWKQSPKVQDDILGKTRGKLFRDGELSLQQFIDHSGRQYTLEDLRRRYPSAFRKAGLNPSS